MLTDYRSVQFHSSVSHHGKITSFKHHIIPPFNLRCMWQYLFSYNPECNCLTYEIKNKILF